MRGENARSSSVIERIGARSAMSRVKLAPMFVAPFLSRLSVVMQFSVWHSHKPRIFLPIFSSTHAHPQLSASALGSSAPTQLPAMHPTF